MYLFFLFQIACDKSSHCQNNGTFQSGFTLKGYRCLCPPGFEGERWEKGMSLSHTWNGVYVRFFADSQYLLDKFPLVNESSANSSQCILCWIFPKENLFLSFIERVQCFVRSLVCIFLFGVFCTCLLVFFSFFFILNVWHLFRWKSSSYVCYMLNRVTARRVQK